MKPPDNDDDPFHHLMSWDVDQPSMKKDDENDDNSSDADTDNVLVEDASTDEEEEEEEGNDDQDNIGVNDEVKRSFVVQELFPASVPVAADGGDTEAVSPSSQSNPTESTIDIATVAQDGTQLVPNSDPNNDGLTAERQVDYVDSIFDAAAVVECDAKEVSNPFDFHIGGSAMQQQDIVLPDAPLAVPITAPVDALIASPVAVPDASLFALPVVVPTETKALNDNDGVDEIDNHDQSADDLLLSIFDDEAVVSNHQQTCPLEIAPWQQEQSPQHQQQDVLVQENVQENLLDIPLPTSTYDHSHSYRDFQPPVESLVESVADTDVGDTLTDNRLHNPTDVTVTTAAMTTVASTNVNDKMEEDSWATQIPSAYDNNAEDDRSSHGSNEVGPTRRDLEVNYAIGPGPTSANNNYALDGERNYLDGHKVSRKKKGKRRDRVKQTNVNDFDEEHAVHVLPGMVAYTQLNEQADEYGRVHSKKSRSKTPYKQQRRKRRCTAMLCILVIVLLATVAGLIYYLIASPSAKAAAGNNGNGQVELGGGSEEGGNLSDTAVSGSDTQNSIGGGVHDGHIPPKAPTSDFNHDLNTTFEASNHGVTGSSTNGNGTMMVDNNDHHIQHDTSSDISENPGNHSSAETILDGSQHAISSDNTTTSPGNHSTATETKPDENPIVSNNATDSLLLSDSSTVSPTDTIDEDVHHFENTSSADTGGDLSLTTTHGEALVSGISKSYGIVFDVESRVASLTITGMDLYLDTSFSSRYEVWLAQGSWKDGAEFVEIAHGTIDGTGVCHDVHLDNCEFAPIPSDEFDSTTITIGQRKSFWVTLRDDDLVSRNRFVSHDQDYGIDLKGVDAVYATNTEMNVYYGTSILTYPIQLADPETEYRSGRGFIGKIRYKVVGTSDNLADPFDIVQHTKTPVMQTSDIPSAQPSSSPTNTTPQDQLVESCHYVTEESCREAASSLGLQLGGVGFPFAGPYSRSGCYFYSCSNCLYGGIAYFGTKGTVSDFQSTLPVHSEKRLDCNTNLYSIEDDSPFWCLFPTKKCAGC